MKKLNESASKIVEIAENNLNLYENPLFKILSVIVKFF